MGQKRYNQKDGVGKSKYVISYHDGKKKHKDGSDFFDIQIFRNKKDLAKFVNTLHKGGYKYGFDESVNEAKNDNLYVVIDFHEKGGGFVMTKPSSKKLADDSARSITKTRDIKKREVVKVKDARKIRGLAGKQYLKEESVNERTINKRFRETSPYGNINFGVEYDKDDANMFFYFERTPIVDLTLDFKTGKVKYNSQNKKIKIKKVQESLNESKTKESKVIQKIHQYTKTEKKFYDELAKHEVRIGQRDYAKFIIMALKGFGINPREYKRIPDAEEKLYQTVSKK